MPNQSFKPRKIAVVTGNRADYGHLVPVLQEIRSRQGLELQLIVTGAHLSAADGLTVREIEKDGFPIAARIPSALGSDSGTATAKSVGLGTIGLADAFELLRPDILLILGDRYEILAAACAAVCQRIPIGHIHGGEVTEGAIDELIRHAITKMSHLHFVTAEAYRQRVLRMGEASERTFLVGAPSLDRLMRMDFMSRAELKKDLGFPLGAPLLLCTYHPVTTDQVENERGARAMVEALQRFPAATIVLTSVNNDPQHHVVRDILQRFARTTGNAHLCGSLGYRRYVSLMKLCDVVVGNSSSGVIEAPSLGIPSVNIGTRQQGRSRTNSILDCDSNVDAVAQSIARALDKNFRRVCGTGSDFLGDGKAASRIVNVLETAPLSASMLKPFSDQSQVSMKNVG